MVMRSWGECATSSTQGAHCGLPPSCLSYRAAAAATADTRVLVLFLSVKSSNNNNNRVRLMLLYLLLFVYVALCARDDIKSNGQMCENEIRKSRDVWHHSTR